MHPAIPNFRSMTADGIEIEVSDQFPPLAPYLPSPNWNPYFFGYPSENKENLMYGFRNCDAGSAERCCPSAYAAKF